LSYGDGSLLWLNGWCVLLAAFNCGIPIL
jgi:hypothetical protein